MTQTTESFRTARPVELAAALSHARDYTLMLFDCLAAAGVGSRRPPRLAHVNPPLWELGHIAWFAERYVLRNDDGGGGVDRQRTSMLTRGDDWFDPQRIAPAARWELVLPSAGAIKMYCHEVLDRVQDKLTGVPPGEQALYPYRLALSHEDMRGEALAAAMQSLEAAAPPPLMQRTLPRWSQGEIRFAGGNIRLGAEIGESFVFDNEKWAHTCQVPSFLMDSTLVSNAQYEEFIADGGYENPHFWTPAGSDWLKEHAHGAPRDWVRDGGHWRCRRFAQHYALTPAEPVRHISLFEAQAYCVWAARRLPTEAEWEYAAMSGHPALRWGDLWEWTCTPFDPYPGFAVDVYREYSAPHFGSHQVLRGASFATQTRMKSIKFRNFALPGQSHLFAGFRTCAV
jgi:iron(II)-dependent oxidoreductase